MTRPLPPHTVGEAHPRAKLTEDDVRAIRHQHTLGYTPPRNRSPTRRQPRLHRSHRRTPHLEAPAVSARGESPVAQGKCGAGDGKIGSDKAEPDRLCGDSQTAGLLDPPSKRRTRP